MNEDERLPSPRGERLEEIEVRLAANERLLQDLERAGAHPRIALRDLRVRLREARATLETMRAEAPDALVRQIQWQLATWAGNRDPLPDPRRGPPSSPTGED